MHIKLDFKIFLFIFLFLVMRKIEIYAMLMIFGLIHEIGHLISGLSLGMKTDKVEILPYGFKLALKINYDDYNNKIKNGTLLSLKKIIIYICGPLINIIIAIIMTITKFEISEFLRQEIVYCNIFIAIFNLLPIYPLDGGKIVFEFLHIICGLKKTYKIIQDVTWITLIILTIASSFFILYFKNISIAITIIYLWILVLKTERFFRVKEEVLKNIENKYVDKL